MAQSMILQRRGEEFEKVKTIDMMNKSLEIEQLRLMKQFNRKTRISKQFRTLS